MAAPPKKKPRVRGPRLVGREREVGSFASILEGARTGRGGTILFAGPRGVGRTRLLLEIGLLARDRGALILSGNCIRSEPGGALRQILRFLLGIRRDPIDRGHLCQELARHVGPDQVTLHLPRLERVLAAGDPPPPAEAPTPLIADLVVRQASPDHPVAIVIDDLHDADPTTLSILSVLAGASAYTPIVIVASAPAGKPAEVTAARLGQHGPIAHWPVAPLGLDGSVAIARACLNGVSVPARGADGRPAASDGDPPESLVDALVATADGIPKIPVIAVPAAVTRNAIVIEDGQVRGNAASLLEIASKVAQSVADGARATEARFAEVEIPEPPPPPPPQPATGIHTPMPVPSVPAPPSSGHYPSLPGPPPAPPMHATPPPLPPTAFPASPAAAGRPSRPRSDEVTVAVDPMTGEPIFAPTDERGPDSPTIRDPLDAPDFQLEQTLGDPPPPGAPPGQDGPATIAMSPPTGSTPAAPAPDAPTINLPPDTGTTHLQPGEHGYAIREHRREGRTLPIGEGEDQTLAELIARSRDEAISVETAIANGLPHLIVCHDQVARPFPIAARVQIGREIDCNNDLVIPHQTVSSRHCRVFWAATTFSIEDLASSNRTKVGGHVLHAGHREPLRPHTDVWVGGVPCLFVMNELGPKGEPAPGPDPRAVMAYLANRGWFGKHESKDEVKAAKGDLAAIAYRLIRIRAVSPEQWAEAYRAAFLSRFL